jgi:uncharacterized protein YjdB
MRGIRPLAVRRALVWAAATVVWSCSSTTESGSDGSGSIATIVVTPQTPTVSVGAEIPLQASVQDASGKAVTGVSILWTVQDSKIAKISTTGVVTGLAVGTTQVSANANGKFGIAAVTVQKTPVASVAVLPKKIDGVSPGTKSPLTGTAYDASQNALTDRTIVWTTSNELVATVDANGVVTAVAPGTATITGTAEGKSDAATITVTQAAIATVEISPNPLTLSVSQSTQMTATAKDANGTVLTGRTVTWASSDQAIATIDASGKLTAVTAGTATITGTSEGKSGTSAVTISTAAVGSVSVQPQGQSIVQGTSLQLTAIVKDQFENVATNRAVTWSSNNTQVATVTQAGLVTGTGPGTVTITATSEGKSGTTIVTVTPIPVASVTIQPPGASAAAGKTSQLSAVTKDANGNTLTGRTISWSSSATNIATVSSTGLVTAVAVGTTVITASSEGKSGTANFVVLTPILAVGSVSISPSSPPSVIAGQTTTLSATVKDVSGATVTDRTIAWASGNTNVATVSSSGVVTGVTPGSTSITATAEGKSASVTVNILPVPVGTVSVSPGSANTIIGTTQPLTVTVKDLNGTVVTDRVVTWSSGTTSVATVNQAGVVSAAALGTATITATSEGKSGASTITVVPVPVGSVSLEPAGSTTIVVGGTQQYTPTVKDQNGKVVTDRVVTWSSSGSAATVSSTGKVTGVSVGTVTITATSETKTGTATIVVVPVPVGTVTVSPGSASVLKGQTTPLTATVKDQNGVTVTDRQVSWSSNNESVASVSSSGVVTGVGFGTATITASSEGKVGSATVNVTQVGVGSVTVTPSTASISVAGQQTFTATVKDANGTVVTDRIVSWSSSAPLTASVIANGATASVTGILPGSATITASAEGKSGSATISVALVIVPVATVTVAPTNPSIVSGATVQLTATTKDILGGTLTGRTVGWSSDNPTVASVSGTGLVTGGIAGSATITATSEGKTGTSSVTVTAAPVATVALAPLTATIAPGATQTFTPTLKDANGNTLTGRAVVWQSSNTGVATVNGSGVVTGGAEGTSTITATSEGKTGTATVTVQGGAVATVTLAPPTASILIGGTQQLTATLKDAAGHVLTRAISWTSTSAATVSSSGLVTGAAAGTATVTATSEGKTGTATITVTAAPVSTVTVTPNPVNTFVAFTQGLTATLKDANGNTLTGRTVTWQSSNTNVATVNATGVVTGKGTGTAIVTATSEGKPGTTTVNVTLAPVSTVDVTPAAPTVQVNATLQLTATLKDANGNVLTGRAVSWSSDNTTIVTVNSTGVVTGKKSGAANVAAASEGKTGTSRVTVPKR